MARNHSSLFRIFSVLGVLALQFSLCAVSRAQMGSVGTVSVLVLDSSGAAVQGAKLVLQDLATNELRTVQTQGAGTATFASVPLGAYKLTITKDGFQTEVLGSVIVQGGRVTDVKVALKVGATNQTVVVEGATPLVETTSNAIATTIDMKQIEDLPLQGRNISNLAFLTPGFSGTGGTGTWNGLPLIAEGNTIDGVVSSTSRMKFSGNTSPGLEARLEDIEEMTVQTEQVDLSQGMGMASMQVNFATRRGSNDFHGRIFEDFRNRDLNANSWFNNAEGRPRNPFIRNEFGASVGGPIFKDKLFFFGSFAMQKTPGGFTENRANAFLSPLAQQGIFTYTQTGPHGEAPGTTVNLFTQVAGPAGQPVCGGSPDPCAAFLAQIALINKAVTTPGTIVTATNDPNVESVSWLINSPTTRYYPAFRVDYNATRKVRIDFSFEETKYRQPGVGAPFYPGPDFANQAASNTANNYIGSFGVNWTVTPTLINQFRGGYYYNAYWNGQGSQPTWTSLPQIGWALGNSGESFNLPQPAFYPVVNFSDRLSWQHAAHSINFGFDFYREQDHYWNPPDGIPNVALGLFLGDPALQAFDNYFGTAGDAGEAENLYATIIGRIDKIGSVGSGFPYDQKTQQYLTGQHGPTYNLDELQKGWGLYAQDSFHITPHFTFNYGLRWDFTGDDHDLTAAYHGAGPEQIYGPSGVGNIFKPGTLTGNLNPAYVASSHQYNPFNVTPQPMVGLAWNPAYSQGLLGKLFNGNTVIRAGFDIKRFTEPYQYFWDSATNHALAYFQGFTLNPGSGTGTGVFAPGSLNLPASADDSHLDAALANQNLSYALTPPAYAASLPESLFTWRRSFWGGSGFDPHINEPYVQEWNLGIQRQLGSSNVLEIRYVGHRAVHQWIATDPNEVNIIENGFLKEFQNAQSNLNVCLATPSCASSPSFGDQGLSGQVPLPIFDTAFKSESGGPGTFTDYKNATFRNDLLRGAAGALADILAYPGARAPYICNLVGSSLAPCTTPQFGSFTTPGPYPLNFFQANPYADGDSSGQGSALANIGYMGAGGYGTYHALQVDFRQKAWHGMQFDVNYTYSHTLGLQPDGQWTGSVTEFTVRNLRQSYGPTTYDLRHVVHGSGTFDLPFGKGKVLLNHSGALDRVVGGWTLGTIFTYESGFPFQLFGGYKTFNDYGDGGLVLNGVSASQLQNAIGVFQPTASQCPAGRPCTFKDTINPALFGTGSGACNTHLAGACQNTTAGNFGFNPWLYGPHLWNDDMSLSKAIPFSERFKFTLQAEFLNIFNHPNWANPNSTITSGSFGTAGNSNFNGARQIELRANIIF
jgi:carboxypeptidase family protein